MLSPRRYKVLGVEIDATAIPTFGGALALVGEGTPSTFWFELDRQATAGNKALVR